MAYDDNRPAPDPGTRRSIELDAVEALRLLGTVSLGRIVFTRRALPTVRPVNHVLVDGDIVIRTHEGAALTSRTGQADGTGVVVAYEADLIDPDTHLGWSVVVTGYAHLVTDPRELARYEALLRPWLDRAMEHAVRIHPELVTGTVLVGDAGEVSGERSLVRYAGDGRQGVPQDGAGDRSDARAEPGAAPTPADDHRPAGGSGREVQSVRAAPADELPSGDQFGLDAHEDLVRRGRP